ncbi:MAG: Hsp20/alpha crystallin family protein [Lachnospiraceae bacterium]|jgi:HSP20 family molecular chaperone IbpA|nr:Hsp20/alpha crystallin family protein [Lachnospiraceae bacterium]
MMLAKRNNNYNLWDDFFADPFFRNPFNNEKTSLMQTDICEKDDQYQLHIELPGFTKENIQAQLKDGYLTIMASREEKQDDKDKKGNYIRRERFSGSCKRSFYVGDQVRQEDIAANFKDGVLTLTVPKESPKAIEEKPKYIAIE